jgi:hypothetical protein
MSALAVKDRGVDGTAALIRTPAGYARVRFRYRPRNGQPRERSAATAVASVLTPLSDIVQRAAILKSVARRGEVTRCGDVTIVDDHTTRPQALSRALAMMKGETR